MDGLQTVEKIFVGRQFLIPDYQRGYAWEEQQWLELLEDIDLLPPGKSHFTGMVVLQPLERTIIDRGGQSYRSADVVDGQQRLTTLVILLEAIRRSAEAEGLTDLAAGIDSGYMRMIDRSGQPIYRLDLGPSSQAFFEQTILADTPAPGGPRTTPQRRLLEGRRYFDAYLARKKSERGEAFIDWLFGLHDKVTHRLGVIPYEVEDAAEVGLVFEVMNSRGKPLSQLDLVKNYVLYLATKIEDDQKILHADVAHTWASLFESLMDARLGTTNHEDQLLRAHWLMAYDYQQRNWDGARSIKARFSLRAYADRNDELLADLRRYVQSLKHAATAYADILQPTRTSAFTEYAEGAERNSIKVASERLLRTNVVAGFIPLLIATRLRYPGESDKYRVTVDLCERYAFRVYRLLGRRANAGHSALFRIAFQLNAGTVDYDEALVQVRDTLLYYCPNAAFERIFTDPEAMPDWYQWTGLKYLLFEYESYLAKDDKLGINWREVEKADREKTIEHILPQTPTDSYWTSRFDSQAIERLTNDLGNLVLTTHNSSYGNLPFPGKKGEPGWTKPCYARSPLRSEQALAAYDDWTPESVANRRGRIIQWALDRWAVEEPAAPVSAALIDPDEEDSADAEDAVLIAERETAETELPSVT